jgi:protein-S-isoprenylcysteine O-methyltransferase Ste14
VFAWTGAALFLASLAYFLYCYLVAFGRPAATTPPGAIAWNVTLFSIFALHHSVFARERIRAQMARLVPPRLERSFYVWVASLLFIAVCALWQPVAGVIWEVEGAARGGLWLLQLFAAWLTLRSAGVIDVMVLAGVKQAGEAVFRAAGPYGWVRHPIYSGWFLLVFAVSPMTGTRLVFAVTSSLYLLLAIPFEERSLRTTTAGAYDQYTRQVRWKLIPGVY